MAINNIKTKEFKIGELPTIIVKYDGNNRIIYRKSRYENEDWVEYNDEDKIISIKDSSGEEYYYNPPCEQNDILFFCSTDAYKTIPEYKYADNWKIIESNNERVVIYNSEDLGNSGIYEQWIECYPDANVIRYRNSEGEDHYYDMMYDYENILRKDRE